MPKINILFLFIFLSAFLCGQDTVSEEIDAVKPLSIIYSANVVCTGDSVVLSEDHSPIGTVLSPVFVWDINGTTYNGPTLTYTPSQEDTRVILRLYDGQILIATDTVHLYSTSIPKTSVKHDTICYGEEATISITGGKYWYWPTTSQVSSTINIRPYYTTAYAVYSSEYPIQRDKYINECYAIDTAYVIVHRDLSSPISGDTLVCANGEHTYSVARASKITWWDGNTQNPRNIFISNDTTLSYVGESVNGCKMQDTLSVRVIAMSQGTIEGDSSFCIGDTVALSVLTTAPNVRWFNGDTAHSIRFIANVSFTVYCQILADESSADCNVKLEHPIEVKECMSMFFPSGFKPDGITSTYGPIGVIDAKKKYQFSIYNSLGKRIFETTDLNIRWDGKIGGKNAPAGVYVYLYRETVERYSFEKKGTITLVR
ncbi:MAG: gliding motility-associated C-terminal domain-containing protein [Bacteroidales bacterium]|jgi:hypothetical protein|nr:gliding motility-associated C-terminal domain-containing protein [Bacteroidales bacterium]